MLIKGFTQYIRMYTNNKVKSTRSTKIMTSALLLLSISNNILSLIPKLCSIWRVRTLIRFRVSSCKFNDYNILYPYLWISSAIVFERSRLSRLFISFTIELVSCLEYGYCDLLFLRSARYKLFGNTCFICFSLSIFLWFYLVS